MLCSARRVDGLPLAKGIRATCFSACKDDLINAGATYVDEPVVVHEAEISPPHPNFSTVSGARPAYFPPRWPHLQPIRASRSCVGPYITARTPADLTPFVHAIIDTVEQLG